MLGLGTSNGCPLPVWLHPGLRWCGLAARSGHPLSGSALALVLVGSVLLAAEFVSSRLHTQDDTCQPLSQM